MIPAICESFFQTMIPAICVCENIATDFAFKLAATFSVNDNKKKKKSARKYKSGPCLVNLPTDVSIS